MEILLDTHVLIWYSEGNKILDKKWIKIIEDPACQKYVSFVSLWEMNIKIALGKLSLSTESLIQIIPEEINILYPKLTDLSELSKLPMHHRDPFDRMIISQAINNQMLLMSSDSNFEKYDVSLIKS